MMIIYIYIYVSLICIVIVLYIFFMYKYIWTYPKNPWDLKKTGGLEKSQDLATHTGSTVKPLHRRIQ